MPHCHPPTPFSFSQPSVGPPSIIPEPTHTQACFIPPHPLPAHPPPQALDILTPLGRGQALQVSGPSGSGKSSLLLDVVRGQRGSGVRCIYAAVGASRESLAAIAGALEGAGCMGYTTVVAAPEGRSLGEQYAAVCAACCMGEAVRNQGELGVCVCVRVGGVGWGGGMCAGRGDLWLLDPAQTCLSSGVECTTHVRKATFGYMSQLPCCAVLRCAGGSSLVIIDDVGVAVRVWELITEVMASLGDAAAQILKSDVQEVSGCGLLCLCAFGGWGVRAGTVLLSRRTRFGREVRK